MMTSNIKKLLLFLKKKKYNKIFIITGLNSFKNFRSNKLFSKYIKNKSYFIYYKKNQNFPDYRDLIALKKLVNKFNPDLILAVGGGVAIDYAKLINVFYKVKNIKKTILKKNFKPQEKKCELVAIPTTAGSGSEATKFAVIYVNNNKFSIEHDFIKPDFTFLIPGLLLSVPINTRASSGFDAFAQAIESMISTRSTNLSLKFSVQALKLIVRSYLNYVNSPNLKNSLDMIRASNFSGKAINVSKTTGPHAISYPFTVLFGLSHGHAVSINFSKFILFNYLNRHKSKTKFLLNNRYKVIFRLTKSNNIYNLYNFINRLIMKSGLTVNYKKLKIDIFKEYKKIISLINLERLSNNPVKVSHIDLKNILTSDNFFV